MKITHTQTSLKAHAQRELYPGEAERITSLLYKAALYCCPLLMLSAKHTYTHTHVYTLTHIHTCHRLSLKTFKALTQSLSLLNCHRYKCGAVTESLKKLTGSILMSCLPNQLFSLLTLLHRLLTSAEVLTLLTRKS